MFEDKIPNRPMKPEINPRPLTRPLTPAPDTPKAPEPDTIPSAEPIMNYDYEI